VGACSTPLTRVADRPCNRGNSSQSLDNPDLKKLSMPSGETTAIARANSLSSRGPRPSEVSGVPGLCLRSRRTGRVHGQVEPVDDLIPARTPFLGQS